MHRTRVALFENASVLSDEAEQQNPAQVRTVRRSPFLYYLLAGIWSRLNVIDAPDYLFIRLLNLPLGLVFLFLGWRCIVSLTRNPAARIMFFIMLSNTLMLTTLCASITWDVLSIVFAAGATYQFIRYWQEGRVAQALRVLLLLTLGALTKSTILPLCLLLTAGLAVAATRNQRANGREPLSAGIRAHPVLLVATITVMLFATWFFGRNLLAYGTPVPRPHALVTPAELHGHPSAIRTYLFNQYADEKMSFEEAKEHAERIEAEVTRRETINLLNRERLRREDGGFEPRSRITYFEPWIKVMTRSTYGFLGHHVKYFDSRELIPFYVFHGLGLIGALVLWRRGNVSGSELVLATITFAFALFVMQYVCYRQYLRLHIEVAGIQGRYLFPVIVPFYAIVARGITEPMPVTLRWAVVIAAGILFIYADFWFYLTNSFVF